MLLLGPSKSSCQNTTTTAARRGNSACARARNQRNVFCASRADPRTCAMSFTPWSHSKTSTHLSSARPSAQVASAVVSPPLAPLTSVACFPDPQNTGQTRRGSSRFSQIRSRGQLLVVPLRAVVVPARRRAARETTVVVNSATAAGLQDAALPGFCGGTGPGGAETFVGPAPARATEDVVDPACQICGPAALVRADGVRAARQPEPQGLVVVQGVGLRAPPVLLDYARRWTWR